MYHPTGKPVGLYVEEGKQISKLSYCSKCGKNNYNMCFGDEIVNGVFKIDNNNKAFIEKSTEYKGESVKYATQSGPLMVWNGKINPKFSKTSENYNVRNGVGIMPDGKVVMIIAYDITFYNFASIFKDKFGCLNAMFLDGAISEMYISNVKQQQDLGGNFGVIIYEEK